MQDLTRSGVFRVPMAAIAEHGRPPAYSAPGGPGMFSLADPARINEVLTASGFERVASTGVNRSSKWGDDAEDAAAFFLGSGPVHALFADAEADTLERVREAITAALRPYQQSNGVRLSLAAWLVTAVRREPRWCTTGPKSGDEGPDGAPPGPSRVFRRRCGAGPGR